MAWLDSNADGALDAAECEPCPAIREAFAKIDSDGDDRIARAELTARIDSWSASGTALLAAPIRVLLDGRPLADAKVTLVPEAFLGDAIKPSSGVTDRTGVVRPSVAKEHLPDARLSGAHFGFYKVTVSKFSGGSDRIPAKYNAQTTLGLELSPNESSREFRAIELSTR